MQKSMAPPSLRLSPWGTDGVFVMQSILHGRQAIVSHSMPGNREKMEFSYGQYFNEFELRNEIHKDGETAFTGSQFIGFCESL